MAAIVEVKIMIRFLKDETPKDKLINSIIAEEWEMFEQLQSAGVSQSDENTFYTVRYAQHSVFSETVLQSWLSDLRVSKLKGFNLVALKYAYMTRYTDYAYFDDNIRKNVPEVSDRILDDVDSIVSCLVEYQSSFSARYPKYSARPRTTAEGIPAGDNTSFEAYARGELETYSVGTLKLVRKEVEADALILEKMQEELAKLSGYAGVADAEAKL